MFKRGVIMSIKLVKLKKEYEKQLKDMLDEWTLYNNTHETDRSPYAIFKNDYHDFDYYLSEMIKQETNSEEGHVPASTYFALDEKRNIFVGAINIRHYLNDRLLKDGGHIGDGVRPSERKKGYATEMIKKALPICKELGIDRVLMVCYKDNIGSKKSIINNGGILENEILEEDGKIDQRYWINL